MLPKLTGSQIWFAITRRSSLDADVERALKHTGQVVAHYRKGSLVAACKGAWRMAKIRAVKCKEKWTIWASRAAATSQQEATVLRTALDTICLSTDGVVPLDLDSREAAFGPSAAAYLHS